MKRPIRGRGGFTWAKNQGERGAWAKNQGERRAWAKVQTDWPVCNLRMAGWLFEGEYKFRLFTFTKTKRKQEKKI